MKLKTILFRNVPPIFSKNVLTVPRISRVSSLFLAIIMVGCGVPSPSAESSSASVRYVCADDVTLRNEDLSPINTDTYISQRTPRGSKVEMQEDQPKQGDGDLKGHTFIRIKFAAKYYAWISATFLKTMPCKSHDENNSVLHFSDESPGILAMLDTIAYSEFRGHPEATQASAYSTIYDFHKFYSFQTHPRILVCSTHCSDASGRYQFMSTTWSDSNRYLSQNHISEIPWLHGPLTDFSPKSQDKMAIFKIWWRFGYTSLKKISYGDNDTLWAVTKKLSLEWASLPGSPYGQGQIDWESFKKYYWSRYLNYH